MRGDLYQSHSCAHLSDRRVLIWPPPNGFGFCSKRGEPPHEQSICDLRLGFVARRVQEATLLRLHTSWLFPTSTYALPQTEALNGFVSFIFPYTKTSGRYISVLHVNTSLVPFLHWPSSLSERDTRVEQSRVRTGGFPFLSCCSVVRYA